MIKKSMGENINIYINISAINENGFFCYIHAHSHKTTCMMDLFNIPLCGKIFDTCQGWFYVCARSMRALLYNDICHWLFSCMSARQRPLITGWGLKGKIWIISHVYMIVVNSISQFPDYNETVSVSIIHNSVGSMSLCLYILYLGKCSWNLTFHE